MNYKSCNEMAKKWHKSSRTVRNYCIQHKIFGAEWVGKQWLIPENAKKPIDGRTKFSKDNPNANSNYHFPILTFSKYYNQPEKLNDFENQLLLAQKYYLEGKRFESIEICNTVLSLNPPMYIKIGIYYTIAFSSMVLGLFSRLTYAHDTLKKLISEVNDEHKEDYNLLLAFLQYHIDWNCSPIFSIDPSKLSLSAIPYYKFLLLIYTTMIGENNCKSAIDSFRADCRIATELGITPMVLSYNCLLGAKYLQLGNLNLKDMCYKSAVKIAVENNWIAYLAKYYVIDSATIDKYLSEYSPEYTKEIKSRRAFALRNWSFIHNDSPVSKALPNANSEQLELFVLLSYDKTDKEIQSILNYTQEKLQDTLNLLYSLTKTNSREELAKYSKEALSPTQKTDR